MTRGPQILARLFKRQGPRLSTWNNTENCLMTPYLPHSDDVSKSFMFLRDFVLEYHHAKLGGNRATNKVETEGVGSNVPPSLYFAKIPQPELG